MSDKRTLKKDGLLPSYLKKIGLLVMLAAFVPAIVVKAMGVVMIAKHKELFHLFTLNAFIAGLLLVAWYRDKLEDEMTISLRLKAMAGAFIWCVCLIVISPIAELLLNDSIATISGHQLIVDMLLAYLVIYYLQKVGR